MWVLPHLGVAFLLVAGALLAVPSETLPLPMPEHRSLRAGDAAAYELELAGAWVYDGLQDQLPLPGPRFEVLDPALVTGPDGSRLHAFPVLTETLATTLLPDEAGAATWHAWRGVQWLDGQRVATQAQGTSSVSFGIESRAAGDAMWTYPHGDVGDCILSPPGACDLPAFHIRVGDVPVQDLGVERVAGAALHHVRADDGTTQVDWWFAQDIPFPVRFEAASDDRWMKLRMTRFHAGEGASEVLQSGFAPTTLEWQTRRVWGPDDSGLGVFPLSAAYEAAMTDPAFPDLRQWMAKHAGYVFMAEPAQMGRQWTVHLSDGTHGFSFQATREDPLLPFQAARVTLRPVEPSPLAASAPAPADAPATLPTIGSLWERWEDHAPRHREGANVWAFRILAGAEGPLVHMAAGRAQELHWGHDLQVLGVSLGGTQRTSSILVLDGEGRAMSYRETDTGTALRPATAEPFTPGSMPALRDWPWTPAQTGAGLAALAAVSALAPKMALALFTRFRPGELLEHPMRAMVMDAVRAEPGLHFRALCSRLDANPGRVRHHVRKLVEGGHLIQRVTPGYTCYFPHDGTPRSALQAGPLMRSDGARSLVGCLAQCPGANAKELALRAGLSPATATYHLKRLQEVGLVEATRHGRSLRLRLTPDGQQALAVLA